MSDSLHAIYAGVPSVACKGLCHDQCTLIPIAKAERAAIEAHTKRRLRVMPEMDRLVMRPQDDGLTCRFLKRQRCSIYEARPLICRLYGAADGLECSHGCRPVGPNLQRPEVQQLIGRLDALR